MGASRMSNPVLWCFPGAPSNQLAATGSFFYIAACSLTFVQLLTFYILGYVYLHIILYFSLGLPLRVEALRYVV